MFTNEQIEKLARATSSTLGEIDIVGKRWSELTGFELEDLPMLAHRLAWALLDRIAADADADADRATEPEPEPPREWTLVTPEEAEKAPEVVECLWITFIRGGQLRVGGDRRGGQNRERISYAAAAWMPRLEGEEPPAPYVGPIPAVEA